MAGRFEAEQRAARIYSNFQQQRGSLAEPFKAMFMFSVPVAGLVADRLKFIFEAVPTPQACKAVEVLMRQRAFVVKKIGSGAASANAGRGQITWSKFNSPAEAWAAAKEKANWQ